MEVNSHATRAMRAFLRAAFAALLAKSEPPRRGFARLAGVSLSSGRQPVRGRTCVPG